MNARNEIVTNLLLQTNESNEAYERYLDKTVNDFFDYTQLPPIYEREFIDKNFLSDKILKVFDYIKSTFNTHTSTLINLNDYRESGFIAALLLKEYFLECFNNGRHINDVMFIDTNLLLKDYKNKINEDNVEFTDGFIYSDSVLYEQVKTADFIIWDKFTMVESKYEISKMYEILSVRYRRCLGNLFFSTDGISGLSNLLDKEIINVMNITEPIINITKQEFRHIKLGVN